MKTRQPGKASEKVLAVLEALLVDPSPRRPRGVDRTGQVDRPPCFADDGSGRLRHGRRFGGLPSRPAPHRTGWPRCRTDGCFRKGCDRLLNVTQRQWDWFLQRHRARSLVQPLTSSCNRFQTQEDADSVSRRSREGAPTWPSRSTTWPRLPECQPRRCRGQCRCRGSSRRAPGIACCGLQRISAIIRIGRLADSSPAAWATWGSSCPTCPTRPTHLAKMPVEQASCGTPFHKTERK